MTKAKIETATGTVTVQLVADHGTALLYGSEVRRDGELIGYVRKASTDHQLTHGSIAYGSVTSTDWRVYGVDGKLVGPYRTRKSALARIVADAA